MAYGRSSRRAPARSSRRSATSYRAPRARSAGFTSRRAPSRQSRKLSRAPAREIRIVIEQAASSPVGRPDLPTVAPVKSTKAKF